MKHYIVVKTDDEYNVMWFQRCDTLNEAQKHLIQHLQTSGFAEHYAIYELRQTAEVGKVTFVNVPRR